MRDPSFSSLYVVPDFPSMLFSYLFTTSSPLHLLFLRMYSVVWYIVLVVAVLGGEFCAHSCLCCRLSYLEVTSGLGENCRNFLCNMGATQPKEYFFPLHLANPCNHVNLRYSQLFLLWSMQWISSIPPFPPFLPPGSVFPIIVWMGDLPAPGVQHST